MIRDLITLSKEKFDLIIIGGGIYGATAAWDASLRGLKVALVEKGDFGSGTSSNSLKIIHGGLRYIQQADIKRMRESIRERRILMSIAPNLVHPLPCLMPLYGHLGKGPEVLRVALLLNDIVGFDRNRISDPQKILPKGRIISKQECLQALPGIRENNLSGGAVWYDCNVYNSERLLISYLRSASEKGAQLANYCEVKDFIVNNRQVSGVKVKDHLTDNEFEIQGKMVLNTSGPWVNQVINFFKSNSADEAVQLSWAMNVITRPLFSEYAAGISGQVNVEENGKLAGTTSKVYFITPWRNYSLVGTVHKPYYGTPAEFRIKESFITEFIQNINKALPGNSIGREDVQFFYGGLLPMDRPNPKNGEVFLTKHYDIIDHSLKHGMDGIVSVVGVKYTTARDVSAKAINYVMKKLNLSKKSTETDSTRIFGGNIDRFEDFKIKTLAEWKKRLPEAVVKQLALNYGSEYSRVLKYGEEDQTRLESFPGTDVLPAEVIHAVREEMAVHLVDVLWRRTEIGSAANPGENVMRTVAKLMAGELSWDKNRIEKEVQQARQVYIPAAD